MTENATEIVRCSWCILRPVRRVANPMLFSQRSPNAVFCSFDCRDEWHAQFDREHTPEIKINSEAVATLRKIGYRS